jgi:uncharacterized protein YuzE
MKIEYTPETDTLYIEFRKGKNVEGEDLNDRTVAFYTPDNELVALEIEHAREAVNLRTLTVNGRAMPVKVLMPGSGKKAAKKKSSRLTRKSE